MCGELRITKPFPIHSYYLFLITTQEGSSKDHPLVWTPDETEASGSQEVCKHFEPRSFPINFAASRGKEKNINIKGGIILKLRNPFERWRSMLWSCPRAFHLQWYSCSLGKAQAKQFGALKRTNDSGWLSATRQDPPSSPEVVQFSKGSECGTGFKITHTREQTPFSLSASLTQVGSDSRNFRLCVLVSRNLKTSFLAHLWGATSVAAGLLKEAAGWVLILPLFCSLSRKNSLRANHVCMPPHAWACMTGEKQCCLLSWPTSGVVLLTLGDFFTPVWHLAVFLHYLSLETLRSIIFLSVKANVSTI